MVWFLVRVLFLAYKQPPPHSVLSQLRELSFKLYYFLKILSPNIVLLGIRASTYDFGGIQFNPQHPQLGKRAV